MNKTTTTTTEYVSNGLGYLTSAPTITNFATNKMTVTQTKVAVFEVTRNDKNEIIDTKFIKELWVQTKNSSSLDLQVAKDAEISKYDPQSISIRTMYSLSF